MQELVTFVARQLVEHPDDVQVDVSEQEGVVHLTLKVNEADKGKVIGKQGKVIKAIRALVSVTAQKADKKANLEVA